MTVKKPLLMWVPQKTKPKTLSELLKFSSSSRTYSRQKFYSAELSFYRKLDLLSKRWVETIPLIRRADYPPYSFDCPVTLDIRNAVFDLFYSKKKLTLKKLRTLYKGLRKHPKGTWRVWRAKAIKYKKFIKNFVFVEEKGKYSEKQIEFVKGEIRRLSKRRFSKFLKFMYYFSKYRFRFGFRVFDYAGFMRIHPPKLAPKVRFIEFFQKYGRQKFRWRRPHFYKTHLYARYKRYFADPTKRTKNNLSRQFKKFQKLRKPVCKVRFMTRKDRRLKAFKRSFIFPNKLLKVVGPLGASLTKSSLYNHLKKELLPDYATLRKTLLEKIKRPLYYLRFKKKKNNYYFTIYNHSGEVIHYISSGRFTKFAFNRRNKKLRSSYFGLREMIRSVCGLLKKKKIFKIHFFLKPMALRSYLIRRVFFSFLYGGIKIMNFRNPMRYSHGNPQKNKKKRRL